MKKEKGNEENENSQYYTVQSDEGTKGYCMNKILASDRADEYRRALKSMEDFGFEITGSVAESVALKMDEYEITEKDIMDALLICHNRGKKKIDYFFAVVNKTIEGWDNSANQ